MIPESSAYILAYMNSKRETAIYANGSTEQDTSPSGTRPTWNFEVQTPKVVLIIQIVARRFNAYIH